MEDTSENVLDVRARLLSTDPSALRAALARRVKQAGKIPLAALLQEFQAFPGTAGLLDELLDGRFLEQVADDFVWPM